MGTKADMHCHLHDERYAGRRDAVINKAIRSGVKIFLNCGTSPDDWDAVAALAAEYQEIVPAFGVHPWYIDHAGTGWESQLRGFLLRYHGVVGEIGLDRSVGWDDQGARQEYFFLKQLEIAREFACPVSVHCRKTWDRLIPLIKKSGIDGTNVLIHSFSGSDHVARLLVEQGYSLSFSCSITNRHNAKIEAVLPLIPDSQLLTETDSPDIPPFLPDQHEKIVNEPVYVALVLETIARFREWSIEETETVTYSNAKKILKNYLK